MAETLSDFAKRRGWSGKQNQLTDVMASPMVRAQVKDARENNMPWPLIFNWLEIEHNVNAEGLSVSMILRVLRNYDETQS